MAQKPNNPGIWGKVLGVVKSVAPTVATAIGGPLGGIAVNAITSALGVETEDQAIAALQSDPNAVLKLREAEMDLQKFMREADLKEDALYVGDTQDARGMAVKLGKIWPQFTIFITLTIIIGGCLYMLFTQEMPPKNETVLIMMLGNAVTAWLASIYFFTGTTKSSSEKTQQIAELRRS